MSRLAFVCVLALAVVAMQRPANAAVSSTFALVGPNPLNATCPVNANFTGTINGPPGTNVTYVFSHFVNGSSVITGPMTGTIPASGSLAISETLPIDLAHSGFQSNEVDTTAPNASQGKVFFTVNCLTITPSGPPGINVLKTRTSTVPKLSDIPFPDNLTFTKSAKACGDHGGFAALFCPGALHDGYLILVWDWTGNTFHPAADGYRVYRVDGGQHKLIDTQTSQQLTISFQKPPAEGFGGKCYAVTAYAGSKESQDSASYCAPGAYVSHQTKTLRMFHWAFHHHEYVSCGFNAGICVVGTQCGDLCMGWSHHDTGANVTLDHENIWWRSYLQFDPSQILGLNVFKATLQLKINAGSPLCFGAIGAADGQAWDTDNVPNASWEDVPPSMSNTSAVFDVTNIVREWARGSPNWGFAFKGTNEDTGAEDNGKCTLEFNQNGALVIEYY